MNYWINTSRPLLYNFIVTIPPQLLFCHHHYQQGTVRYYTLFIINYCLPNNSLLYHYFTSSSSNSNSANNNNNNNNINTIYNTIIYPVLNATPIPFLLLVQLSIIPIIINEPPVSYFNLITTPKTDYELALRLLNLLRQKGKDDKRQIK